MSMHEAMAARHGAMLSELAELGLALARDLQGRALAAADDAAAAQAAAAFHRVARSVRQTLALEARLERDRSLAAREATLAAEQAQRRRGEAQRARVRAAVARLIWTEAEGEEAESLLDDLDERLAEAAAGDPGAAGEGGLDTPEAVAACVAWLCVDLGLAPPAAAAPRDLAAFVAAGPPFGGGGWRGALARAPDG